MIAVPRNPKRNSPPPRVGKTRNTCVMIYYDLKITRERIYTDYGKSFRSSPSRHPLILGRSRMRVHVSAVYTTLVLENVFIRRNGFPFVILLVPAKRSTNNFVTTTKLLIARQFYRVSASSPYGYSLLRLRKPRRNGKPAIPFLTLCVRLKNGHRYASEWTCK